MINTTNASFEDYLCEKVIEELKLDKDLWAEKRPCEYCKGSGLISDYKPDCRSSVCPTCNGKGKIKIGYR